MPSDTPNLDLGADVSDGKNVRQAAARFSMGRVEQMQEELVDRFGDLPPAARALIESHRPAHPGAGAGRGAS